ncbi:MAG TPA: glycosyltransferase family 2 protein [Thermodesulfobacteriota bacterium]|nr:glycosyltransferase family 2 protein [Thermodesulfobacteriota bacterium]
MSSKTSPHYLKKLIIQIPCYNEEKTLAITLRDLPRQLPGIDNIEWLVIDDGCTDKTVEVAKACGVDHVVSHTKNMGLAKSFMTGLHTCLDLEADIIVNTDADNQYNADDIPALTEPILAGRADIVVGARPIDSINHFSPIKKILQKLGSRLVRMTSGTDIPDATSGFRAMSRDAAQQLVVFDNYTYTLETIIQAGQKNMAITSVPVRINANLRPSKLLKNIPSYLIRSVFTIVRIFIVYRPFRFFVSIGALLCGLGVFIGLRFLWFYFNSHGGGHIQSLILASILLGIGFQTMVIAVIADLLSVNRKLLEEIRLSLKVISRYNENSGQKNRHNRRLWSRKANEGK